MRRNRMKLPPSPGLLSTITFPGRYLRWGELNPADLQRAATARQAIIDAGNIPDDEDMGWVDEALALTLLVDLET